MKNRFTFLFVLTSSFLFSQHQNFNVKKGFIAEGYDVVSYFTSNKAVEGNKKIQTTYNNVKYAFVTEANKKTFLANPEKYIPQYGGWCAYAFGTTNEKVSINPKTFEIRDGKLYLFYNSWGINTLEKWTDEGPEKLQKVADKNWKSLQEKQE